MAKQPDYDLWKGDLQPAKARKKPARVSPTQRTLKRLRETCWLPWITEHWNAFAHIRQDLFGFCDVIAVRSGETIAVQCTTGANVAARVRKLSEGVVGNRVQTCLAAGWRVEVWGWRKIKVQGVPQWGVRIVPITSDGTVEPLRGGIDILSLAEKRAELREEIAELQRELDALEKKGANP